MAFVGTRNASFVFRRIPVDGSTRLPEAGEMDRDVGRTFCNKSACSAAEAKTKPERTTQTRLPPNLPLNRETRLVGIFFHEVGTLLSRVLNINKKNMYVGGL